MRGLTQGRQFFLQEGDVIRDNLGNILQPLMDGFKTYQDASASLLKVYEMCDYLLQRQTPINPLRPHFGLTEMMAS